MFCPGADELYLLECLWRVRVIPTLGDVSPPSRQLVQSLFSRPPLSDEITAHGRTCPPDSGPAVQVGFPASLQRCIDGIENRLHLFRARQPKIADGKPPIGGFHFIQLGFLLKDALVRQVFITSGQIDKRIKAGLDQRIDSEAGAVLIRSTRIFPCEEVIWLNPVRFRNWSVLIGHFTVEIQRIPARGFPGVMLPVPGIRKRTGSFRWQSNSIQVAARTRRMPRIRQCLPWDWSRRIPSGTDP